MGTYNQNWEEIGRNIQTLVDEAIGSQDYQKLNQTIRQTVSKAVDLGGTAVKKAVDTTARAASTTGTVRQTEAKTVTVESRNLPALYGSANGKTVAGVLKVVGGSLLSLFTFFRFSLDRRCPDVYRSVPAFFFRHSHPVGLLRRCWPADRRYPHPGDGRKVQYL